MTNTEGRDLCANPATVAEVHQETGAAWDETAANYEREEADSITFLRDGGSNLLAPSAASSVTSLSGAGGPFTFNARAAATRSRSCDRGRPRSSGSTSAHE